VRTDRLRGDVCNPDYDFLDPKIGEFYDQLTQLVSLSGWIHGLKAVTSQLGWAWHEVATMERLFPSLPGMAEYKERLRNLTKTSNQFLLTVVEDLTYSVDENRENKWTPEIVEKYREQFLNELLADRDGFVYRNEEVILESLTRDTGLMVVDEPETAIATGV
jgi:hypothetical protein